MVDGSVYVNLSYRKLADKVTPTLKARCGIIAYLADLSASMADSNQLADRADKEVLVRRIVWRPRPPRVKECTCATTRPLTFNTQYTLCPPLDMIVRYSTSGFIVCQDALYSLRFALRVDELSQFLFALLFQRIRFISQRCLNLL